MRSVVKSDHDKVTSNRQWNRGFSVQITEINYISSVRVSCAGVRTIFVNKDAAVPITDEGGTCGGPTALTSASHSSVFL